MVKSAIWILAAVCAPVLFDAADAMDVERANAQYKDREYRIELDLVLHQPAARIEAVLRDYASYPSLGAGILESKILSRPDEVTVMLYTKLRACSGLFCRTVQRVERVQESAFELLAVVVPEQSDVTSGQSHTVLQTIEGGTRVSYRLTIVPKFWVPPLVGRTAMLRTLREVSLDLFRQIEVRAQRMTNPVFAERLLDWFDQSGRKHLPWQQNITPYRVWVSEIMLQQTQVSTVIPYYERFMQRFPDVFSLASAPVDEVLHLWTGLGYYARARNMHRAAQEVVRVHGGEFPCTLEAMQSLPGIGRSTAGAILSIACDHRQPILDGNVKRVLTRYFGVAGYPGEKRVDSRLWNLADDCTPIERVADYTQAIMDLGATVCTRARPQCDHCPMRSECVAKRDNLQTTLPTRRPKRVRPQRKAFVLVATNASGAVFLERRPPSGIWGGLWTFPQFDNQDDCIGYFGPSVVSSQLPVYHHSFTHFDLELQPVVLRNVAQQRVADSDKHCWYDPANPPRIGLAKPVTDIIRELTSSDGALRHTLASSQ